MTTAQMPVRTAVERQGEYLVWMQECACGRPMTMRQHNSCPAEWAMKLAKMVVCNQCADRLSAWWEMEPVQGWAEERRHEEPSVKRLNAVRARLQRFQRLSGLRFDVDDCVRLFQQSYAGAGKMIRILRAPMLDIERDIQRKRDERRHS